jgi:trimethylamine--corrinoid protein Co-methyltransferase
MALSDAKSIDAQAGAETFGSAVMAALAGINSVSGPGMLDFVLVFSLPKLVLDNELCGQALRLVRPLEPVNDIPTIELARQLLDEQHLITAEHTLNHWPQELYMPGPVYDRTNRETWNKSEQKDLVGRATDIVNEKLATYQQLETDAAIEAEMRRLMMSGLQEQTELPAVPKALEREAKQDTSRRSRRRKR